MTNSAELVTALVMALRDIPELVTAMEGDRDRISGYYDHYPDESNIRLAIARMRPPAILVAWQGTVPGRSGPAEAWRHLFSLYLRAGQTAYTRLWHLIVNGVPASGDGQPMLFTEVHPDCYPIDTPSIRRNTLVIAAENVMLDYFEISTSLTEK